MTNTLLLPRYDAYGRMLAATEPDAKAHFTMYAVARDEIEQLRQERHQLRNELTAARLENERLLRDIYMMRLNAWVGGTCSTVVSTVKSNPAPETSGGYACMNCAGAGCSDCTPALQSNPPRLPCIYREGCKNYDHCLAAGHCHPL